MRIPLLFTSLVTLLVLATGCSREGRIERTLIRAESHLDSGALEEAEIEFKNVLQLDDNNARAIGGLGLVLYGQGRVGAAYPYLLQGSQLLPDYVDVRAKLASLQMAAGQNDQAYANADAVLDLAPGNPEAPVMLVGAVSQEAQLDSVRARLLGLPEPYSQGAPVLRALGAIEFRQRRFEAAEDFLRQAEALDPDSPETQLALSSLLLAQGDTSAGAAAFKRAADLSPPRSPYRLQYAQYLYDNNQETEATQVLQGMISGAPFYLPAYVTLAEIALQDGRLDECENLLGRVFARDDTLPEALLLSIRLTLARGNASDAVAQSERLRLAYPGNSQVLNQLGLAYEADGQLARSASTFREALSVQPGLTAAAINLGRVQIQDGNLAAAVASLRQLIERQPDSAPALRLLAEAYRQQGNLESSLNAYRQVDQQIGATPQTPFLQGLIQLRDGDRPGARQSFNAALDIDPDYATALEQLVNLDLSDRLIDEALARVTDALTGNPDEPRLYVLLARVRGAQGDLAGAESVLQDALRRNPDDPSALSMLTNLYLSTNQPQQARASVDRLLTVEPENLEALLNKGMLSEEASDFTAAREAYEKLLALSPQSGAALNNLAFLYADQFGDLERARELAERARLALPGDPHVADTLAWILFQGGQHTRALGLLQESARALPDSSSVQFHLGSVNYWLGNEDAARSALRRSIELGLAGSDSATANARLRTLDIDINSPGARQELESAVAARPTDPMALVRLAMLQESAGEESAAAASYQSALQSSPDLIGAAISLIELNTQRAAYAAALETARAARLRAPENPSLAHAYGRLRLLTGDFVQAQGLLREASRGLPDSADAQLDYAVSLYSLGRSQEAVSAAQSALQSGSTPAYGPEIRRFLDLVSVATGSGATITPSPDSDTDTRTDRNYLPAIMAQAVLRERQAGAAGAIPIFEQVIADFPQFAPAKRRLSILLSANDASAQRSLDLGLEVRESYPNDHELTQALGIAAFRLGDFTRARTWLTQDASLAPGNARTQYYLGLSLRELNEVGASRTALQRALDSGQLEPALAGEARRILDGLAQ